jgi:hypothetical protein
MFQQNHSADGENVCGVDTASSLAPPLMKIVE